MDKSRLLDPADLRQLLRYDPEAGRFWWMHRPNEPGSWNKKYANKEAFTCVSAQGYRVTTIMSRRYSAHRVAWAMTHGRWPRMIDHVNGARQDNRIVNLREVTDTANARNRCGNLSASSRFKGVCWIKRRKAWIAQIQKGDALKSYLGQFRCETAAAIAYDRAALRLHGEYARFNLYDPRTVRTNRAPSCG